MSIQYKGYVIYLVSYGWRIKDTNYSPATLAEALEIIDGMEVA
jgi:hypothetical protein